MPRRVSRRGWLGPRRRSHRGIEYWMDQNNVLSQANWAARPPFMEGVDRSVPLLYLANGGRGEREVDAREEDVSM